MRKVLLIAALSLLGIATLPAQRIDGFWKADEAFRKAFELDDDELNMDFIVHFDKEEKASKKDKEKGAVVLAMPINSTDDEIGTLGVVFALPGTYVRTGSSVTATFNKDDVDIKITEMHLLDKEVAALIESSEESWNAIAALIEAQVKENNAKDMENIAGLADLFKAFTIESVTKDRLVIAIGEDTITFDRYEE